MALILNIDTSSPICSVCLAENGIVLGERNDLSDNKHASQLTTFINELLAEHDVTLNGLSAVALSSGPGSYTGLRIGTSVAKGICYGLAKPLISVSTLQGLAYVMSGVHPDPDGLYIPMLDARRNDVYMSIYDADNNIIKKDTFATVDADFADNLTSYSVKNIYFGGSGAKKVSINNFNDTFGTIIENLICVAKNIKDISYKRFLDGKFEDHLYFEPVYLKEFEGQMKIK